MHKGRWHYLAVVMDLYRRRVIDYYLMTYYNWERPHRYSGGLAPAVAEEKLKSLSGNS